MDQITKGLVGNHLILAAFAGFELVPLSFSYMFLRFLLKNYKLLYNVFKSRRKTMCLKQKS